MFASSSFQGRCLRLRDFALLPLISVSLLLLLMLGVDLDLVLGDGVTEAVDTFLGVYIYHSVLLLLALSEEDTE